MKKLICGLAAALLLTLAAAAAADDALQCGDFSYVLADGGARVTNYMGNETDVVIPDELDGYPVTEIGGGCFYWDERLVSVACPDSLQVIGDNAFTYCGKLETVLVPDGLTTIGEKAFFYCESLTDFTIPPSVTAIGASAFYWCSALETAYLPEGLTALGTGAFMYCDLLTAASIPAGITEVPEDAFCGCHSLVSVALHDGVTRIGEDAFFCCESLADLALPDNVQFIGDSAFSSCESLTDLALPGNIRTIGWGAFRDCVGLRALDFPEGLLEIGSYAFMGCTALEAADLPAGLCLLGTKAFADCGSLTSARIPAALWLAGNDIFDGCARLEGVDYYGPADPAREPLWTPASLELYLGCPLSGFTPGNPEADTCLLVVDPESQLQADGGFSSVIDGYGCVQDAESVISGRMRGIQKDLAFDSGDRIAFASDPQQASVLLIYAEKYPGNGEGFVSGIRYKLYDHTITITALDLRTNETIATVTEGKYLEVGSHVITDASGFAYASAPSLRTEDVKAFIRQVLEQSETEAD